MEQLLEIMKQQGITDVIATPHFYPQDTDLSEFLKEFQYPKDASEVLLSAYDRITENALYLLDEPENSLSIKFQLDLAKYISDSARHFGCQFIISTHSPILLSLEGAKIYDLDSNPVTTREWTELDNVKKYYEFFKEHEWEFE